MLGRTWSDPNRVRGFWNAASAAVGRRKAVGLKRWVWEPVPRPGAFCYEARRQPAPLQPARPLQRPHPFVSAPIAFPRSTSLRRADQLAVAAVVCRSRAELAPPGQDSAGWACPNREAQTCPVAAGVRPLQSKPALPRWMHQPCRPSPAASVRPARRRYPQAWAFAAQAR